MHTIMLHKNILPLIIQYASLNDFPNQCLVCKEWERASKNHIVLVQMYHKVRHRDFYINGTEDELVASVTIDPYILSNPSKKFYGLYKFFGLKLLTTLCQK